MVYHSLADLDFGLEDLPAAPRPGRVLLTSPEYFDDRIERLPAQAASCFEGAGDALWHAGRYLLWGGFGFRSDPAVYPHLASRFNLRLVTLRLGDEDFYHLDTCLSILDERSALIYPGAIREEGLTLIRHFFDKAGGSVFCMKQMSW